MRHEATVTTDTPTPIGPRTWIFIGGQGLSLLGTELGTLALPVVAVVVLGLGPGDLSLMTAASFAPALFAPVFAGPLADRFDRLRLLVLCDLGRAVVIAAMIGLYVAGALGLGSLLGLLFVRAVLANIFDAAYFSVLPDLMDKRQLVAVNGRLSSVQNSALVAGPAIGGALAALWGVYTMLVDAASYLISVSTLVSLRRVRMPTRPAGGGEVLWELVASGFRTLWQLPPVRLLALSSAAINLFLAGQEALLVLFGLRSLGLSATVIGICVGVGAVGGLAMGLLVERLLDRLGNRILLVSSAIAMTLTCAAIALTPREFAAPFLATALFVQSAMVGWYTVVNSSLRQLLIPRDQRGRVFASMRVLTRGVLPLGAVLAGGLAAATSVRTVLLVDALGLGCVTVWLVTRREVIPSAMSDVSPS
jgi:MFS family permease